MGFLSAIGGILGGIAGPFGAAAGAGIGSLLEGKKPKDALISAGLAGGTSFLLGGRGFQPGAAGAALGQKLGFSDVTATGKAGIGGLGKKIGESIAGKAAEKAATATVTGATKAGGLGGIKGLLLPGAIAASALSKPEAVPVSGIGGGTGERLSNYKGSPKAAGRIEGDVYIFGSDGKRVSFSTPEELARLQQQDLMESQKIANPQPKSVMTAKEGGFITGPGGPKDDMIPAMITQNGKPVQQALLSDGEFVMTADAVKGGGGPAAMYRMMKEFENRVA
jgi:hypothetical protein|tara:strand:+ start:432 stop:1268 length:837 start_codon:yes stop_codon:yes gene_type:complete